MTDHEEKEIYIRVDGANGAMLVLKQEEAKGYDLAQYWITMLAALAFAVVELFGLYL